MYKSLKKVANLIIPKQVLRKNEIFLRKLISIKYKGKKHKCNICNFQLKQFVELKNNDLLCPRCGSRSRTRRLFLQLEKSNLLSGQVLHFSPPRSLFEKLKKQKGLSYFGSDFENEFLADHNYDITSITRESNFFDLIICYHVLEHIENDQAAMKELYRVLKPSGSCYIQTPFKEGDIYEDLEITAPKERKKAFGQEDHVRIYSINGLKNRLESVGFKVETKIYENDFYLGLKNETVIVARKN